MLNMTLAQTWHVFNSDCYFFHDWCFWSVIIVKFETV